MKKTQSFLALDLGTSYVKIAEVQIEGAKTILKNLSATAVPHELKEIESLNNPSYIEFIKKLLSEKGITAKETILCISHPQLEIKDMLLPSMSLKELKTSIEWEIKEVFSMPIEEAVFDYKVLGEIETGEGKKIELCAAAIPIKVVDDYIALLNALSLAPIALIPEPLTAYHALKGSAGIAGKKAVTLINMGAEKTIASVFEDNKLKMLRTLPVSSNRLTGSIAARVKTTTGEGLDIEKAEEIKCKYGIPAGTEITEENINPQDIFSALRPSLEDLATELSRFVEYYKAEHEGRTVDAIIAYGGASKLHGLSDYITKNTSVPVIQPDITRIESPEVPGTLKEMLEKYGAFLVNVLGAVLIRDKSINLLPPEFKEKKESAKEKRLFIKIWACLAVVLVLGYTPILFSALLKQKNLTRLQNEYTSLSFCKEELDSYGTLVDELKIKMDVCNELLKSEPFWEDLLKELANLIPDNIVINELSFGGTEGGGLYGASKPPLILSGIVYPAGASQQDTLTRFLQQLEKSVYFKKIKLEFSKEGKTDEQKVLEFKIGLDIK